jgi:hypothetical protein
MKTLTYVYSESTAVLGPLATFAEPHAYDLCEVHSSRLTVPKGWTVIRPLPEQENSGPSVDDLMAIADAVREVGNHSDEAVEQPAIAPEIGRRGHLRVLPSN